MNQKLIRRMAALLMAIMLLVPGTLADSAPFEGFGASAGLDIQAVAGRATLTPAELSAILEALIAGGGANTTAPDPVTYGAAAMAFLQALGCEYTGEQDAVNQAFALGLFRTSFAPAANAPISGKDALFAAYIALFSPAPALEGTQFETLLALRNAIYTLTGRAAAKDGAMTLVSGGLSHAAAGIPAELDGHAVTLWYRLNADGGIGEILFIGTAQELAEALLLADGIDLGEPPVVSAADEQPEKKSACACGDSDGSKKHKQLYSEYDLDKTHTICGPQQNHTCEFCKQTYTCAQSNEHARCKVCGGHWCVGEHSTGKCGLHRRCEDGKHDALHTCGQHYQCQAGRHNKAFLCGKHYTCSGDSWRAHTVGQCKKHFNCQGTGWLSHNSLAPCGKHFACAGGSHFLCKCGVHYACEGGYHANASCRVAGHFLCDGLTHTRAACGVRGHYACDGRTHAAAACGIAGHYGCDGQTHTRAACGNHYSCQPGDHSRAACGNHFNCQPGDHGQAACGTDDHYNCDGDDHSPASCNTNGHYNCDGRAHSLPFCGTTSHYQCDGSDHSRADCSMHYRCERGDHSYGNCGTHFLCEGGDHFRADCGNHFRCASGDHSNAACGTDGHYNCDGLTHTRASCGTDGHYNCDGGDHRQALCAKSGHYRCDGDDHGTPACGVGGHNSCDDYSHVAAPCGITGHYDCDGQTHTGRRVCSHILCAPGDHSLATCGNHTYACEAGHENCPLE